VADSWVARLLLNPGHYYRTGDPPDIFWNAFYLLVPLTGLLQLRLARHEPVVNDDGAAEQPDTQRLSWQDFSASLRLFLPFVAAVLVSAIILVHASLGVEGDGRRSLIAALTLSITLLLLVIVRQEVMFLENARLQRATEEAQANALALREVNRRMEHFLGIVSHELRTPLAVLQGYIQLLARRFGAWRPEEDGVDELARTVARARTALEQSDESVHRLTRLVDDLLDDTQIRDGRLAFHLETFDLGVIVRRAVEEQRMLAADRTILLEPAAPQPMFVSADAARIGQVVTNYLTNALKYSRKDRPIAVRVEEEGDVARVSVRDEGAGVPVAEQERVWARYSRVDGTEVQAGSGVGLGLGLYISKSIIEGHHGQVGVRSAPGRGATFWFTLPLVRRAA